MALIFYNISHINFFLRSASQVDQRTIFFLCLSVSMMLIVILSGWKLGTLGAGNHYAEIQVVDEIYNDYAAKKMGIDHKGQVCVMIHSGSRGLGHQVATGRKCS